MKACGQPDFAELFTDQSVILAHEPDVQVRLFTTIILVAPIFPFCTVRLLPRTRQQALATHLMKSDNLTYLFHSDPNEIQTWSSR